MGSDFTYLPTKRTIIGVMVASTVLTGLVNSLSTYWMEKMTKTYVIFHIAVLISCSIALLVKCENRHDAKYVFTDVDATSGWTPVGLSWLFGFLSVSWTVRASRFCLPLPCSWFCMFQRLPQYSSSCAKPYDSQMTNYDATARKAIFGALVSPSFSNQLLRAKSNAELRISNLLSSRDTFFVFWYPVVTVPADSGIYRYHGGNLKAGAEGPMGNNLSHVINIRWRVSIQHSA